MDNWSACKIRGQARDLVVVSLYLKDGEGMSPTNLARLGQVHGFIKSLKVPWIILGDFNMGPDTLDQGGFLDLRGGSVITADLHSRARLSDRLCHSQTGHSQLSQPLPKSPGPMEPSCGAGGLHPGRSLEGHDLEVGYS